MNHIDFTPRAVTKFVVTAAIARKTAQISETAITDYTALEEDSIAVGLAGNVVGWFVADKLKPYTDTMVDKTANFVNAKREARQAKKDSTKKED